MAFRLTDEAWTAVVKVERLPQTVQAEALHLFSIGEGIAYGSSIINYVISGAPVGSFKVELAGEYDNVEFTGKDIRNWQKVGGGYVVQLHTPVSGAHITLLATYERPFSARGAALSFTGARPLDSQSEQGYTLITSAYQFEVKPTEISPGLLPLETGEIPSEYRFFCDAPVLAAYRYAARPFNLTLALSPLAQGDSLNQVVDRASLETHISKEGQAVTAIRYFVKNRGNPHFRLSVPEGARLWSASVNGTEAVPVFDGSVSVIPLPQIADPNAVIELDLKVASQSSDPRHVRLQAPVTDAPVMLAEWKLAPDTGQRLVYQKGSVMPSDGPDDLSGFAQLGRLIKGKTWSQSIVHAPSDINLLAPILESGSALRVEVLNVADKTTVWMVAGWIWPAFIAIVVTVFAFITNSSRLRAPCRIAAWTLLAWAALRIPNGVGVLLWVGVAFLICQAGIPSWKRVRHWSRVPATATLAAMLAYGFGALNIHAAVAPILPDSVTQTVRVEDSFVIGSAKIHWQATKGQSLNVLSSNAVLTHISYLPGTLDLVSATNAQRMVARKNGAFDIQLQYEMRVSSQTEETGFDLPTPVGMIHQIDLTVVGLDVDVESDQAVSMERSYAASNTVAKIELTPTKARIHWKPRQRDVAKEKPVYYAELSQLYVPSAGFIESVHRVSIRPAQGEISGLLLHIPSGATITGVVAGDDDSAISLWRFDPETRLLRVTLSRAQSRPFNFVVRSQTTTSPLPCEHTVGLVSVDNAARPKRHGGDCHGRRGPVGFGQRAEFFGN